MQGSAVSGDRPQWKASKRFFHPFWLSDLREWDAEQDPMFSMVLDILRKSPRTIVAVMADAVEAWCCFIPPVTRPAVVQHELELSGHQEACWYSQTVLKPSHHCGEHRNYSVKIISFLLYHLHLFFTYRDVEGLVSWNTGSLKESWINSLLLHLKKTKRFPSMTKSIWRKTYKVNKTVGEKKKKFHQ